VLEAAARYVVKRIEVVAGGQLSLQRHRFRAEQWVVVAGTALVTLDDAIATLGPGGSVHIAVGQRHRVANPGPETLVFIEVQTGETLDEEDIERLEDRYGRA
jgi:mannose-1-phosphate guanylyltransferase/mannose-1-phosphate guanylyltransferase/mannose-6-phosphate isomerase